MFKYTVIFISLITASVVYADELQCFSFDPKYFTGSIEQVSADKTLPISDVALKEVYLLKLPKIQKHDFKNYVAIGVKMNGKIYINNDLDCALEKGVYYCRGLCDSGQVWLDKNSRLKFEFVGFGEGEYAPDEDYELPSLYPKDKKMWIKGKKVACPDAYKSGNYVCHKDYFCERSKVECETVGEKHFGLYPDESSARAALLRCWNEKQKK
ncbi:MAG: hypothetical protein JXQ68_05150 [Campylobacterales bacterium]|nr:hypothetical protein [Campylobacterales bacterium]